MYILKFVFSRIRCVNIDYIILLCIKWRIDNRPKSLLGEFIEINYLTRSELPSGMYILYDYNNNIPCVSYYYFIGPSTVYKTYV